MAQTSLFETLEREHQELLDRIDSLDQKIAAVLKDWGTLPDSPASNGDQEPNPPSE